MLGAGAPELVFRCQMGALPTLPPTRGGHEEILRRTKTMPVLGAGALERELRCKMGALPTSPPTMGAQRTSPNARLRGNPDCGRTERKPFFGNVFSSTYTDGGVHDCPRRLGAGSPSFA